MSMLEPQKGTWWVKCKSDPRWDKTESGYGLVVAGGPTEMHDWIDVCKKKYGEAPEDAQMGFMKD